MDTSPDHTPAASVDQTTAPSQAQAHNAYPDKGKGKLVQDDPMVEDEEEDEEDDDEDDDDEEDDEDEELHEEESALMDEINPEEIRPRRTRGIRIDYSSPEAFKKAGINPGEDEDEEDESKDVDMKDD